MVNRFRARIAGLSIILHPFGIFLRNSILKFLGAYGIFYFRLLCMYEAVWVLHIVLFGCFKSLYNCFGLGEYIGRSLFHYVTNCPPMEAFVTVGIYLHLGSSGYYSRLQKLVGSMSRLPNHTNPICMALRIRLQYAIQQRCTKQ